MCPSPGAFRWCERFLSADGATLDVIHACVAGAPHDGAITTTLLAGRVQGRVHCACIFSLDELDKEISMVLRNVLSKGDADVVFQQLRGMVQVKGICELAGRLDFTC